MRANYSIQAEPKPSHSLNISQAQKAQVSTVCGALLLTGTAPILKICFYESVVGQNVVTSKLSCQHVQKVMKESQVRILLFTNFSTTKTRDRRLCLKPSLIQDIDYIFEKTYHLAIFPLGAYLMPQSPIQGSKGAQKAISFGQKLPQKTIWLRKLTIFWPNICFWHFFNVQSSSFVILVTFHFLSYS